MKTIEINENNGYVLTDVHAMGSVSFFANIPDGAIVKGVKADGKYLSDYVLCNEVYPRTMKDGDDRVVAVLKNAERTTLYAKASAGELKEFEIEVE